MYEGWECGPPQWLGEGPIDAVSLTRRFSAELDGSRPAKDSVISTRDAQTGAVHTVQRIYEPPIGNHPLRAHPPNRSLMNGSADGSAENSSGSYHSSYSTAQATE